VSPTRRGTVLKAVVILGLTFVFGVGIGVFLGHMDAIHRRAYPPPKHAADLVTRRLDRVLDLTDEQHTRVHQILTAHHAQMTTLWRAARGEMQDEATQANAEIEQILTPDQRAKFAKIKLRISRPRGLIPFH
jgi:Spy/CpxP family protein refolding chaperone